MTVVKRQSILVWVEKFTLFPLYTSTCRPGHNLQTTVLTVSFQKFTSTMDYFRPPFLINRPPLFQPRMEHFNLMHGPGPFHPSMSPFAMTTPSALSLYLQRPPLPPPPSLHLPMLGAGAYMHSHNQHQPRDPRRQRPSKRVRQRMRRLSQRGEHGDESRDGNSESIPIASESGYDTAGDCLTPATPLDSPTVASGQREFPIDSKKLPEGKISSSITQ